MRVTNVWPDQAYIKFDEQAAASSSSSMMPAVSAMIAPSRSSPARNPAFNPSAYRLADEGKQKNDTKKKAKAKQAKS